MQNTTRAQPWKSSKTSGVIIPAPVSNGHPTNFFHTFGEGSFVSLEMGGKGEEQSLLVNPKEFHVGQLWREKKYYGTSSSAHPSCSTTSMNKYPEQIKSIYIAQHKPRGKMTQKCKGNRGRWGLTHWAAEGGSNWITQSTSGTSTPLDITSVLIMTPLHTHTYTRTTPKREAGKSQHTCTCSSALHTWCG